MTKPVLAIHGAFSTPRIFNYLKRELKTHAWNFVDYQNTVDDINSLVTKAINEQRTHEPYHVVGHSMGGLIALALINHPFVASVTTIATPLGGLEMNLLQSYLSRSGFLAEITSHSNFIQQLHEQKFGNPVQHIITTEGFNPWMYEKTDGVVTLRSQRGWAAGPTHDVEANHAEVMMCSQTVDLLKQFWKTVEKTKIK